MNPMKKPIASPVVVLREEFDDWAVLFNPDTANAVGINPVGVAVWKLMNGQNSIDWIVAEVRNQFDEVPDSVPDEIRSFIERLAEQGFVGYELESTDA
jgi:SynChlorMet cassette protein ScmD